MNIFDNLNLTLRILMVHQDKTFKISKISFTTVCKIDYRNKDKGMIKPYKI